MHNTSFSPDKATCNDKIRTWNKKDTLKNDDDDGGEAECDAMTERNHLKVRFIYKRDFLPKKREGWAFVTSSCFVLEEQGDVGR